MLACAEGGSLMLLKGDYSLSLDLFMLPMGKHVCLAKVLFRLMFCIRVIGTLLFVRDILKSTPAAMLWPRPSRNENGDLRTESYENFRIRGTIYEPFHVGGLA